MLQAILKGITLGLILSISVGPVIFSILKQSLNNGHRGGFAFVMGVSASDISLVLISNVFTSLFAELISYKRELAIVGSIFLVSVGVYYVFFKKVAVNKEGSQIFAFRKMDYAKIFLSGYFMNMLSPGAFIFWFWASTSVVDDSVNIKLVIFITCLLFVLAGDIAKVMLAGKIRKKLTPHNIHIINRVNGFILIGFGIALIWGLLFYANKIG